MSLFLFFPFVEYLVITGAGLFCLGFVMKRKRDGFLLSAVLCPIFLWSVLLWVNDRGSLSNFVIEPLLLGGLVLAALAAEFFLERKQVAGKGIRRVVLWSFLLLAPVGTRFLMPALPE